MPLLQAGDDAWTAAVRAQVAPPGSEAATELARWARVRAPAGQLEMVDIVARAGGAARAAVHAIGLPTDAPANATTTVLAYQPLPGTWDGAAVCGLALDAWVDATPATEETTSIAFHVDTPTSEPPNLWLLAVPDANNDDWAPGDLFAFVDEALDLAQLRAVSPTDLGVDHLLPPWLAYVEPRDPGPPWGTADPDNLTSPPTEAPP